MPNYETIGQLIIQELINIRKDFKYEMKILGDRMEKCLNFHATNYSNITSAAVDDDKISAVPEVEIKNEIVDESFAPDSQLTNYNESSKTTQETCETIDVNVLNSALLKDDEVDQKSIGLQKDEANSFCLHTLLKLDQQSSSELKTSNLQNNAIKKPEGISLCGKRPIFQSLPKNEDTGIHINCFPPSSISKLNQSTLNVTTFEESPFSLFSETKTESSFAKTMHCIPKRGMEKSKQGFLPTNKTISKISERIIKHSFNQPSSMKDTSARPHVCAVCGRSFSKQNDLLRHMYIHTRNYPYVCKCGKKFIRNDRFKKHLKSHENLFGEGSLPF